MKKKPNIILILADDMGYGDLSCLNSESKIDTPHMDRIAREGRIFRDAHSSSAVCSPSRYSILTGEYAWRSPLKRHVLGPYHPPIIAGEKQTWPEFLKGLGYHTALVGKWHLGMAWPFTEDVDAAGIRRGSPESERLGFDVDYTREIADGPLDHGFQEYFGVDVPNFPPYCFIEGRRTLGVPAIPKPEAIYGDKGPMREGWSLERILPELTERACRVVRDNADGEKPFFLMFSSTAPHTPIAPTDEFKGRSRAGEYGDFVMQLDASIGSIHDAVREAGIEEDTLILVTSDNGSPGRKGSLEAPGTVIEMHGHNPSGRFRGMKGDAWEGGHRVPFLAKWPGMIEAGSESSALFCLMDLMKSVSALAGLPEPEGSPDGMNLSSCITGKDDEGRDSLVHHSLTGMFAYRKGRWKLIDGRGSGGFSDFGNPVRNDPYGPEGQLYDMADDDGETVNLYGDDHRDELGRLYGDLSRIRWI